MTQPITAVSLFAGVGGFDLALERNGVKVVAACEIDKHARQVLSHRFPDTQLFNDVTEVTGEQLISAGLIPERGIITGGFPCQDLSTAGNRAGLAGARSGLFWEIIRLAEETQVEWLVLENVPGLLNSNEGRDMGVVLGALVDGGYCVAWRVLDAQHFGVAQRRRRVFIVARRSADPSSVAEILFKRESVFGNSKAGGSTGQETAGSPREGIEEPTLYEPHHGDGRATTGVANTLISRMGTGGNNTPVLIQPPIAFTQNSREEVRLLGDTAGALTASSGSHMKTYIAEGETVLPIQDSAISGGKGNGLGIGKEGDPMYTLTNGGGHALFVTPIRNGKWISQDLHNGFGIGDEGDPMFTITTMGVQSVGVEKVGGRGSLQVRRLTPLECERLQGFPDSWTEWVGGDKPQADSHRYKQMGNAVAVPVVEWVIKGLVEVMGPSIQQPNSVG